MSFSEIEINKFKRDLVFPEYGSLHDLFEKMNVVGSLENFEFSVVKEWTKPNPYKPTRAVKFYLSSFCAVDEMEMNLVVRPNPDVVHTIQQRLVNSGNYFFRIVLVDENYAIVSVEHERLNDNTFMSMFPKKELNSFLS